MIVVEEAAAEFGDALFGFVVKFGSGKVVRDVGEFSADEGHKTDFGCGAVLVNLIGARRKSSEDD